MECQPIEFDINRINNGPDEQPRSAGVHVSAIIRDLANTITRPGQRQSWGKLTAEEKRRGSTYQSMGFAWERALERSLAEAFECGAIVRPGEQECDGIFGTPDLFDVEHCCLEEWKATWKSSRKADDKLGLESNFREWLWQIKAYLHYLGIETCYLRIFFINGDYRDSGPQVKCFQLTFTPREIQENWAMLVNHAKSRGWLP